MQFLRNLTRDCEFRSNHFRAGDEVVLLYASANRDESIFDEPEAFDITRNPNAHVAFGGTGPHYCLGAHLARRELIAVFRELLERVPNLRSTGPVEYAPSSFDNRIRSLPFTFTPPVSRVGLSH